MYVLYTFFCTDSLSLSLLVCAFLCVRVFISAEEESWDLNPNKDNKLNTHYVPHLQNTVFATKVYN